MSFPFFFQRHSRINKRIKRQPSPQKDPSFSYAFHARKVDRLTDEFFFFFSPEVRPIRNSSFFSPLRQAGHDSRHRFFLFGDRCPATPQAFFFPAAPTPAPPLPHQSQRWKDERRPTTPSPSLFSPFSSPRNSRLLFRAEASSLTPRFFSSFPTPHLFVRERMHFFFFQGQESRAMTFPLFPLGGTGTSFFLGVAPDRLGTDGAFLSLFRVWP